MTKKAVTITINIEDVKKAAPGLTPEQQERVLDYMVENFEASGEDVKQPYYDAIRLLAALLLEGKI